MNYHSVCINTKEPATIPFFVFIRNLLYKWREAEGEEGTEIKNFQIRRLPIKIKLCQLLNILDFLTMY